MVIDLLKIKNVFDYDIIIETGTNNGYSTRLLRRIFKKVYTCEIDEIEYNNIHNNTEYIDSNVEHVLGNSPDCLKKWFAEIGHDKFFLYLDAHWHDYWPLKDELQQVIDYGYKPVIVIHDFDVKVPGLYYDSYNNESLSLNYIEDKLEQIYGIDGYDVVCNTISDINCGCIYIYPKDYLNPNLPNKLRTDLHNLKTKQINNRLI